MTHPHIQPGDPPVVDAYAMASDEARARFWHDLEAEAERSEAVRRAIESRIEALIALLDRIDGDENLEEPGDVEPGADEEYSLGWTNTLNQAAGRAPGFGGDLEDEHDGREPDADLEPGGDDEPSDWEAGFDDDVPSNVVTTPVTFRRVTR